MNVSISLRLFSLLFLATCMVTANASRLDVLRNVGTSYGEGSAEIFVWVSPTCQFCKKFHKSMLPKLVKEGFKVTYLVMLKSYQEKEQNMVASYYCSLESEKALVIESFYSLKPKTSKVQTTQECIELAADVSAIGLSYTTVTPTIVFPDDSISRGIPANVENVIEEFLSAKINHNGL